MTSLKQKLNDYIRVNGTVSYGTIKELVETGYFGRRYRMSTAERRPRNESPSVECVLENGYIKYYRWKGQPIKYQTFRVEGTEQVIKLPIV